jgi:hypothetical protein
MADAAAAYEARVINVMRRFRDSEEVWFEYMTNWMDTYYSSPAAFENIWRAQAAQQNLTTTDLTTFKNNVKTRHKPAYTMAKNSHELSPHTKPLVFEHVVERVSGDRGRHKARGPRCTSPDAHPGDPLQHAQQGRVGRTAL